MNDSDSLVEMLNAEIRKRVEVMSSPNYEIGGRLNRKDYLGIFAIAAVCILGMIIAF